MEWFLNNITDIKDFLWIIFTFIATIITVLTYKQAKKTLLQPLRSEVIKRQTDLLIELLDFLGTDKTLFFLKADYMEIIDLNVSILLKEYGFETSDKSDNIVGALISDKKSHLINVDVPDLISFDEKIISA